MVWTHNFILTNKGLLYPDEIIQSNPCRTYISNTLIDNIYLNDNSVHEKHYLLILNNGIGLYLDSNQKILVEERKAPEKELRFKNKWVKVKHLTPYDYLHMDFNIYNKKTSQKNMTPDVAWCLGFLKAQAFHGNISIRHNNNMLIKLNRYKSFLLLSQIQDRFDKALDNYISIDKYFLHLTNYSQIEEYLDIDKDTLHLYTTIPTPFYNIPKTIRYSSKENILAFLAGFYFMKNAEGFFSDRMYLMPFNIYHLGFCVGLHIQPSKKNNIIHPSSNEDSLKTFLKYSTCPDWTPRYIPKLLNNKVVWIYSAIGLYLWGIDTQDKSSYNIGAFRGLT